MEDVILGCIGGVVKEILGEELRVGGVFDGEMVIVFLFCKERFGCGVGFERSEEVRGF